MSRFVELDDGRFVNLDRVGTIRPIWREKRNVCLLFGFDGGEIGEMTTSELPVILAPIVPAAAGTVSIQVHVDESWDRRPIASDVWIYEQPVIAWRVPYGLDAIPVLPEEDYSPTYIQMPDEGYMRIGHGTFENIGQVKRQHLAAAQSAWDRAHPPKPSDQEPSA